MEAFRQLLVNFLFYEKEGNTNHPTKNNRRIQHAINKGQALSTLQGINYVKPI
ncbi:hypothetical protein SAMN04488121_10180 [Chitinophaga filiformis]|uniref:Uncharacterized protein n=1 Tax=Chitinophaga filiformis TaxID=104663 RepID=A0A1G7GM41_CHIFI|nr:hypothetical protein SAMN04488121_10180 [Chitinophaga filiformis]